MREYIKRKLQKKLQRLTEEKGVTGETQRKGESDRVRRQREHA